MKTALLGTVLLLLAGIGALAWSFTPATLEVPALAIESLPAASPPQGMWLSMLPTGSIRARAGMAYRGGSFDDEREFVMPVILIRHPRGNLLVDAGFGRGVDAHVESQSLLMRTMTEYRKGTPAIDQLESKGFRAADLAGVLLTHSHWDHVSGLADLDGVPVWVNGAERERIDNRGRKELIGQLAALDYRVYDFTEAPYLGFPRSYDVWGDGSIVIVPAPGHTPGSVIVFVNLPSGTRYALLGDLVWQLEGIQLPAERPWLMRRLLGEDDGLVRKHIVHMAALHRRFPEIRLVPAHDARAVAKLPVFPALVR